MNLPDLVAKYKKRAERNEDKGHVWMAYNESARRVQNLIDQAPLPTGDAWILGGIIARSSEKAERTDASTEHQATVPAVE